VTQHWLHLEYHPHSHLQIRFTRKLNEIGRHGHHFFIYYTTDSYEDSKGGTDDLKDVYIVFNVGEMSKLTIGSDK